METIAVAEGAPALDPIAALSAEHRVIQDALDALTGAVTSGACAEVVIDLLDRCISFCGAHFAAEEALMRNIDHPNTDEHVVSHADLLQAFRSVRECAARALPLAALDLQDVLLDFHQHVQVADEPAHKAIQRHLLG